MDWKSIDLWPKGKAGVEAKYRIVGNTVYCMIRGSDHALDWIHHLVPGDAEREHVAARSIFKRLARAEIFSRIVIGGHSLGAAVAAACADMFAACGIDTVCYAFGGKRRVKKSRVKTYAYRHIGDIVPFLPPWRPAWGETITFGKWTLPWTAHMPGNYAEFMIDAGLR